MLPFREDTWCFQHPADHDSAFLIPCWKGRLIAAKSKLPIHFAFSLYAQLCFLPQCLMCVIDRCHVSSKWLECREHRARKASLEHGGYKGRVDPVRETEEKDENHCSQSSAHRGCSRRSSRERHHSPRSDSVNDLSICWFLLELMYSLMLLKSIFTLEMIYCKHAIKVVKESVDWFSLTSLIGCRNGYLLIASTELAVLKCTSKKVVSCLKMCCHVFLL